MNAEIVELLERIRGHEEQITLCNYNILYIQKHCKHENTETNRVGPADYRENETICLDCGSIL